MQVNIFHLLGREIVDELTADERKIIDEISTRLSNDPQFEKKIQDKMLQSQIAKIQENERSAQQYEADLSKSFV